MAEPLRIAQIAPIALPVRSDSEGSIEQVVWLLCEELVRRHAAGLRRSLRATWS